MPLDALSPERSPLSSHTHAHGELAPGSDPSAGPSAATTAKAKAGKPKHGKKSGSPAWQAAMATIPKLHRVESWGIPMDGLAEIATAFLIPLDRALAALSNGRVFSAFGEEICEAIKQAVLPRHRDVKGSDGLNSLGHEVSIKSLTAQGVKFQMSISARDAHAPPPTWSIRSGAAKPT